MDTFNIDTSNEFYDEIIRANLNNRKLVLNDEINDQAVEDIILQIFKYNKEDSDAKIPVENRRPIYIYINSYGGDVVMGTSIIDVIKASETPVYTVCLSIAASMSFIIYISGAKRYAFNNSVLLMHDGNIQISNSSAKAKQVMDFCDEMENRTKEIILSNTDISEDFYDEYYDKEFYMYANNEGKELGCVDYIVGQDCKLSEIL